MLRLILWTLLRLGGPVWGRIVTGSILSLLGLFFFVILLWNTTSGRVSSSELSVFLFLITGLLCLASGGLLIFRGIQASSQHQHLQRGSNTPVPHIASNQTAQYLPAVPGIQSSVTAYSASQEQSAASFYPQPPLQPLTMRKIALRYGLIFGAIVAVISLFQFVMSTIYARLLPSLIAQGVVSLEDAGRSLGLIGIVFLLLNWGLYFLAGLFTGRRAQQVGAATRACLWVALCFLVIYCVDMGINIALSLATLPAHAATNYLNGLGGVVATTLILNICPGVGIGTLGGWVGKQRAVRYWHNHPPTLLP